MQVLIVDYNHKKVLLQQEDNHWILPGCLIHHKDFESNCEPIYFVPMIQKTISAPLQLVFLRQSWTEKRDTKDEEDNGS